MKKVFISYSWGNKEHQDWIVNLGTRLMNDTVDVILDRWSLKEGHDIHNFMEEMVKSEDIFRILIISNLKYQQKADAREGGVGTETQIITPNIYADQKQEKFIPIVLERDTTGNPCLPIYLSSRKYIDFSKEENFEDSYEELLRNILETPALPKPKLGLTPPIYITENKINLSETNTKLRNLDNQLKKTQNLTTRNGDEFIDIFFEKLWDFELDEIPTEIKTYGDKLINVLRSFKPLREECIKFFDLICMSESEVDTDIFISFFENSTTYERPREDVGSWSSTKFEIFKIIFQELFLYLIGICLKHKKYNFIADLLQSKYYLKIRSGNLQKPKSYTFLYTYHENLENYALQVYKKVTGFGDYVISGLSNQVTKDQLITADTLCYFVSYLRNENIYDNWFPSTFLYGERSSIPFFQKITSKKHFEKVKEIFGVENENELKDLLLAVKSTSPSRITYGTRANYIPYVYELVDPETIAVFR